MQFRALALVLSSALAGAGSAHAAGSVNVTFINPQQFDDATDNWRDEHGNLAEISNHLKMLGQKYLADSQSLKIDVLNVDLAGRLQLSRSRGEVRVINGRIDWPRITLRYALQDNGQVVQSGEENVSDMAFLWRSAHYVTAPLGYEKRMLDEWFRDRIVARHPARD